MHGPHVYTVDQSIGSICIFLLKQASQKGMDIESSAWDE